MKTVLFYRHADGRLIEVAGDGNAAEAWQIYPVRTLLGKSPDLEAAKKALPDGFALDTAAFSPPCPKCETASVMDLRTGMYKCPDCGAAF